MKVLFVDCNDQLEPLFRRVHLPSDPPIALNKPDLAGDALVAALAGYQIAIDDHSYFTAEVLAGATTLRHIVFLGTGAASYVDLAAAEQRGVAVHTIKGYGDVAVAEHAVALMFAAARGIARMDRGIRAGNWATLEGMQLAGKTLGLIGVGGIARETARIARGIGMNVVAWNRSALTDPPCEMWPLERVLAESDVVSVHLALNDATRGFLDDARLATLKRGAILVNTARGAVIDEAALVRHLQSGLIGHAALDVFSTEPLPADHPLTRLDSVTLAAHAGFCTPEAAMELLRRGIAIARDIIAKG